MTPLQDTLFAVGFMSSWKIATKRNWEALRVGWAIPNWPFFSAFHNNSIFVVFFHCRTLSWCFKLKIATKRNREALGWVGGWSLIGHLAVGSLAPSNHLRTVDPPHCWCSMTFGDKFDDNILLGKKTYEINTYTSYHRLLLRWPTPTRFYILFFRQINCVALYHFSNNRPTRFLLTWC